MESRENQRRASTVSVILMLVLSSFFMLVVVSPAAVAAVTTGRTDNFVPSGSAYIRDDSSAIPILAFGASSNVNTDRLSQVEVSFNTWSYGLSTGELKPLSTDGERSGVALVRDDGDVDDEFDVNDTALTVSSCNWYSSWPYDYVRFVLTAAVNELVPNPLSGNYQWFVVIRTDTDIDDTDSIQAWIYPNDIGFSDGSSQPSGTVVASTLDVRETRHTDVGDGWMRTNEADAVLGVNICDGGPYEKFDRVTVRFASSSGFSQSDLATITTSASTSGVALYRNDGDSSWDSGDTPVDCTSVDTSNWPWVYLFPDDEELPDRPSGSYQYWIVIRTSGTVSHLDRFYVYGDTSSIRVNGTLDNNWDRLIYTPEGGNNDNSYITVDLQAPVFRSVYWSEGSSYIHYAGGTLWFSNATTWTQSATLIAIMTDSGVGVNYVYFSYEPGLASGGYTDYSATYMYTYSFDSVDNDSDAPITLTSYDYAGNSATIDMDYALDVTPPTVTIHDPDDLEIVHGTVPIRVTATDAQSGVRMNSVQVSWDGMMWYQMPWDGTHFTYFWDTTVLPDGAHRIVVRVNDEVSNLGTARANVYVDNTGPATYILWPTAGQYVHSAEDLFVVATATDFSPLASMEARIGSGPWRAMSYDAVNGTWIVDMGAPGAGALTIQVRATDAEGNLGPTASVVAFGDANDPSVSIVSHAAGAEVRGKVTFVINASDAERLSTVKLYITGPTKTMLLDATYNAATGFFEVVIDTTTLADGAWAVAAVAFDQAGRYNVTTPFAITVDNTEPTLAITSPTDGAYVYGTITITATAADTGSGFDVGGCALTIDGGAWTVMPAGGGGQYSYSLDTTGLSDGVHTITVAAIDDAGNVAARVVRMVVDNVAPAVAVVAPTPSAYVMGTYTFAVSAVDNYALSGVTATITTPSSSFAVALGYNAASGYWEWTVDTTSWEDGDYSIGAAATEMNGRTTSTAGALSFMVDNTAPLLVIDAPLDGETILTTSYTVEVTASDMPFALPGVVYRMDAGTWTSMSAGTGDAWSHDMQLTYVVDGRHTLTFRAVDRAGHMTEETITVTVDNHDPAVALNTPSVGEFVEGVYTFSARASDLLGVATVEMHFSFSGQAPLSVADATFDPSSGYWELTVDTTTLPDGPATIQLVATDNSGRQTVGPVIDFAVDNNMPELQLINPLPGDTYLGGSMAVRVRASDVGFDLATGDVEYNMDGTGWLDLANLSGEPTLWGFELVVSTMQDGEHTLAFRVTDGAGHVTEATATFTVDNTDPSCFIMAPSRGEFVMGVYHFRVAASDSLGIDEVMLTFEGVEGLDQVAANFNPASGLWDFIIDTDTLDDAEVSVSAVATDSSGRTSGTAGPVDFIIDNNAPVVAFASPLEKEVIDGVHTVTVSVTDRFFDVEYGFVELSIDGGSWAVMAKDGDEFSYDWNTSTASDAEHNLRVRALDRADHMTEASINVVVDNHDPALGIVAPTDGQYVTGDINFRVAASDARGIASVTLLWVEGNIVKAVLNAATNHYEHSLDTTTLEDGVYELTATAVDGSGRTSVAMVTFNVDNTEPELTFDGPLTGDILFGEVTVRATASDAFMASLQFSVDGVGWVDMVEGEGTFDSTRFVDGEHTITVRAIDGSGKATTASSIVTVDNTAPLLSVADFPSMGEHLAGDVLFALFSTDIVGVDEVNVAIGNESWPIYINPQTGFYEWTFTSAAFPDGLVDLSFTSMDAAGHETVVDWAVFVDNTAPVIVALSPKDKATVEGIVEFEATLQDATGVESVMLRIGYGAWISMSQRPDGTWVHKWETTSDDDQEDLRYTVRVTDDLGNTEDTEYTITVENPVNWVYIVLLVILVVLVVLGWYFMRRPEASEAAATDDEELEEISADLDELLGVGGAGSGPMPPAEAGSGDVEVELEEKRL